MNGSQYTPVLIDDAPDGALQIHENLVALLHSEIPLLGQSQNPPELLPGFPNRHLHSGFHALDGPIVDASQPCKLVFGNAQLLPTFNNGGNRPRCVSDAAHRRQLLSLVRLRHKAGAMVIIL